tara:strand:- start:2135 stop:3088 length:954 start_codon:yes stop_codon:yes gene_type:complete
MKKIIWIHPKHLDLKKLIKSNFKKYTSKILFIEQNEDKLIRKEIRNAEVLINCPTSYFNKNFIRTAKKLKWIHFGGAGVEKILIDELKKSKIILTNGKIIQGPELADHTLSLILYFTRNLGSFLNKPKIYKRPIELKGKKFGILGGGGAGICIAEKLKSFDTKVRIFDDDLLPILSFIDEYYDSSEILENISDLDFIISALPLTKFTKNLINKNFLDKMKKNSILINISRGQIINFKDLVSNKRYKKFKGIGLDVTNPEPLPINNELRYANNVVLTNHTAGLSDHNRSRSISLIFTNIKRYFLGRPLLNVVDKTRGY